MKIILNNNHEFDTSEGLKKATDYKLCFTCKRLKDKCSECLCDKSLYEFSGIKAFKDIDK